MSKSLAHHFLSHDTLMPTDTDVHSIAEAASTIIAKEHGTRMAAITMMAQLVYLCRGIQKHRGLSMGLLAGNNNFAQPLAQLQQQMQRRITLLLALSQQSASQLSTGDVKKITDAWETIRAGWHDDSVLENFQFHSHFIEQLLFMVLNLSNCLKLLIQENLNTEFNNVLSSASAENKQSQYQEFYPQLLHFICCQVPKMVEYLGMMRALSTHTATIGGHNVDHDKKLKYFSQCLRTEKSQVMIVAESLYQYIGKSMPSLLVMKTHEFKLDAFIEKIDSQVIGVEEIKLNSDELFIAATNIMDVYWRVVDDGLTLLRHMQEEQVEMWCLG